MDIMVAVRGYCGNTYMTHCDCCERLLVGYHGKYVRVHRNELGHTSSIRPQRERSDHCRRLQDRDPAIQGVIACKKDLLQVKLADHKKLIE